ncbi:MAG: hypothetical protein IAE95_12455 [Chitinophagaceae bacterium]|nr:hypothetical protein [Chitinophagaceae bacterium]
MNFTPCATRIIMLPFFCAAFLFSTYSAFAQPKIDSIKVWSLLSPLTLKDFKHPIDSAQLKGEYINKASSLLDIKMNVPEFRKDDTAFSYDINAVFFRYLSWIYDSTRLSHERLHFDIGEIYARRMRRWLSVTRLDNESYNMVKIKLNELYYDHAKYHVLYDKETHGGKLPNMQLMWERNLKKQMDTLQRWEKPQGSIKFTDKRR